MKKLNWFLIGLVLIASIAFMGCKDDGVTPAPVDPPVVEPVPPTFEETITGKFWSIDMLEKYQVTTRSATEPVNPYALDVCMYFGDDGWITFWDDTNDDGILAPDEEIGTPVEWSIDMGILTIDGDEWDVDYFSAIGFAIIADVSGTDLGVILGNPGYPYEGYIKVHYVPCMKVLETEDDLIVGGFAFVFDDANDTDLYKAYGKLTFVRPDLVDWFDFTWGENFLTVGNKQFGGGFLWVNDEEVYICDAFEPNEVYDMSVVLHTDGNAAFTFTSRYDDDSYNVSIVVSEPVGAFEIVRVNDVDVPVVNP